MKILNEMDYKFLIQSGFVRVENFIPYGALHTKNSLVFEKIVDGTKYQLMMNLLDDYSFCDILIENEYSEGLTHKDTIMFNNITKIEGMDFRSYLHHILEKHKIDFLLIKNDLKKEITTEETIILLHNYIDYLSNSFNSLIHDFDDQNKRLDSFDKDIKYLYAHVPYSRPSDSEVAKKHTFSVGDFVKISEILPDDMETFERGKDAIVESIQTDDRGEILYSVYLLNENKPEIEGMVGWYPQFCLFLKEEQDIEKVRQLIDAYGATDEFEETSRD